MLPQDGYVERGALTLEYRLEREERSARNPVACGVPPFERRLVNAQGLRELFGGFVRQARVRRYP